jgi:hypothetical protein
MILTNIKNSIFNKKHYMLFGGVVFTYSYFSYKYKSAVNTLDYYISLDKDPYLFKFMDIHCDYDAIRHELKIYIKR